VSRSELARRSRSIGPILTLFAWPAPVYSARRKSTIIRSNPLFLMSRFFPSDVIGCFMPVTPDVHQNCRLVFISSSSHESYREGMRL
jgi:hypothetical protein